MHAYQSAYKCSIKYFKHMMCISQALPRYDYKIKAPVCPRPYHDVLFDTSKVTLPIINYYALSAQL